MASCCPGVTECKHLITIGFLQVFIGSDLQDENGNTMSVSHPNGTAYCPTYSELTGGTLIHNWKQGTTPNGDRDGIIIGGSYASNECVRREDLSMKYTRFKSLGLTASPSSIDACSGCSTLSVSHLYNRYTKVLNDDCESAKTPSVSSTTDTASGEVTYTSSNNVFTISGNTVCVGKNNPNNNGRSNSRSTTITAKITFRGSNKTATATITQAGLTGEYKYWYHTYEVHGKDVDCGTQEFFGCEGGNYSATAFYYQDDWDVYRWQDRCGTNYDSDTEQRNRVDDQYKVYETYSGSFDDKNGQCGTWTASTSWDGYGSCEWVQSCTTCTCDDYIEWGTGTFNGTVPCTGGTVAVSASVPYTAHTRYIDSETKECVDVPTATSTTLSDSVTIGCNSTTSTKTHTGIINHISYTITQTGNCCTPSRTYNYNTITLSCQAHENEDVRTEYTATTIDNCCNRTYSYGWTDYYKVNIGCNSGSTRTLTAEQKSNAPFTIIQSGDIACCGCFDPQTTYTIADIEVECDEAPRSSTSVSYTAVTTYSNCASETVTSTTTVEIPPVECNSGSVRTIQEGNTGATLSEASPKITQKGGCPCACVNPQTTVTFADVELQCVSAASSITSVVYTAVTRYDNCGPETVVSSANVNIPAVECNSQGIKTIQAGNTGTTVETAKPKITQKGGCVCCRCEDLTISSNAESWASNAITPREISISSTCATNISINSSNLSHFNASLSNNKITVLPKGNNSSCSAYTDTLTVSYNAGDVPCSKSISLTQSATACTCDKLTVSPTSLNWNFDDTRSKTITVSSASCINGISMSSLSSFTATFNGGNIIVTPNSQNTGTTDFRETLTISYSGCSTHCSSGVTLVQLKNPCPSGITYEFGISTMACNAPEVTQDNITPTYVRKTTRRFVNGVCSATTENLSGKHIWFEDPCAGGLLPDIPVNNTGGDVIRQILVYLRNSDNEFFASSGDGSCEMTYVGTIPVTQKKCCLKMGTDNNECNEPINMKCKDGQAPSFTSDRYLIPGSHIDTWIDSAASTPGYDAYFSGFTNEDNYGITAWTGVLPQSSMTIVFRHSIKQAYRYLYPSDEWAYEWYSEVAYSYCGQLPQECGVMSFTMEQQLPADGAYFIKVGEYTLSGDCGESVDVQIVNVAEPDFITISSTANGQIIGQVNPNPNPSPRSGAYGIYLNGVLMGQAYASQLGGAPSPTCECSIDMTLMQDAPATGGSILIGTYTANTVGSCSISSSLTYQGGSVDFIQSSSVENGVIYATLSENSGLERTSYYSITCGNSSIVKGITQLGSSVPTYTYTVYDNGNAEGATVGLYNGETPMASGTITNGVYTATLEFYGTLTVTATKQGCVLTNSVTVSPNNPAYVTMTCETPPVETYSYTVVDGGNAEGASVYLKDGDTIVASGTISSGSYDYQTSTYYATLTVVATKAGCDTVETTVNANNTSSVVMSCETPVDPCVNEGAPDIEPYSIQHQYNTSEYYTSSFESSCWRIYSASSNDQSLAEVTSYNDTSVTILCNANELGSSTEVYVYVVRTDGTTDRLQIDLYWLSMQSCSGALYLDSPWAADSNFEDEVIGYYTVDGDCGNITISYIDGDSILLNPTLLANGDVQGGVLENMQGKRQGRYGLFNSGQLLATAVVEQLPSCAAIGYDASGIQLDYIDVYFDSPLTISYPDTSNCWSPTIIYTEGDNLVSDEIYTSNSVTLTFNDTGDVKCYIQFVNTKTGITVRSGDITIQLVQ